MNWSWTSAAVAIGIFVVSSAVGYGVLMQQVSTSVDDIKEIKTEVKELSRSFNDFLLATATKQEARR